MNDATKVLLDHDPAPNVIETEEFHNRVSVIFKQMGEILARSAGPCGAPAIISQYPFHHITKDGYTIRKNISYEKSDGFLDQVIADLCGNICDRLNITVGDGTTAAILVTCALYDVYMRRKKEYDNLFLRPSDIIKSLNELKTEIIESLEKESIQINSKDSDDMVDYIRKVVNISSNGDAELTRIIGDIYKEIGFPAITVEMSDDGIMKSEIFDGYLTNVVLTDASYINNDNMTMDETQCDVLIYDHKISMQTYETTLRPLSLMCKARGRKLLVMAPYYDTTAMPIIAEDLNKEKRITGTINLVLMNYKNSGWLAMKKISDLAMLCSTSIINSSMDLMINNKMEEFIKSEYKGEFPFCLDGRNLEGLQVEVEKLMDNGIIQKVLIPYDPEKIQTNNLLLKEAERSFRVGYVGSVSAGLKKSIFKDFNINEELYRLSMDEARKDLDDTIKKYSQLGGFNIEVNQRQDRFMSLNMKMATIFVGADSEFSRNFVKDVVDDCVRAAESAYRNGIIKGCHVSILRALHDMDTNTNLEESLPDKKRHLLISSLIDAYKCVYKRILLNANPSEQYISVSKEGSVLDDAYRVFDEVLKSKPRLDNDITSDLLLNGGSLSLYDFIIKYSIETNTVFDFNHMEFTQDVINSTATDREILKSAIDLIGLLITGNQLIISRPR